MSAPQYRPVLERHPFCKDFGTPQLERLAALARPVAFAPEEVVFETGDLCNDFYLIVGGRVALEMPVGARTLRIQTLSDGDEFGFSALITGRAMSFRARALQRVEALAFDGGALLAACRADAELGFSLMRKLLLMVSERLDATRLQLMDTYSPVAARAGA
ncbi:MAG: cyclic nucleotide-binding domain-containing protein [Burkholderiaceae bacterium]|jgi:CRP-like cAMP-binding protein|nr:cyclic nucleotide-binding domain-containing protein [Burkholderiaceae bacterium]MCU0769084.1 cyclic nucleotide-binding domain-containing protein [Burkholderiaceae bacterium]